MNLREKRKYGAIYADLPWYFRNWSAKGTGRNAVSHYDCMDFEAMARLPVQELAAEDCGLFLWAIDPLLTKALELVAAWGFEYKTVGFYWVKQNKAGEGFFTRREPDPQRHLRRVAFKGREWRRARRELRGRGT